MHLLTRPSFDRADLLRARINLTKFVATQGELAVHQVGVGSVPTPDAPDDISATILALEVAQKTKTPFPVSSLYCDNLLFLNVEANYAMRMWHDMRHISMGFSFEANDEMLLGAHHLDVLRASGYGAHTLEHKLFHADTVGQTQCLVDIGKFPTNQLRFAITAARLGLDHAIELEAMAQQTEDDA
jgi:hypothetical protein